ncbi:MAG: peroxiredoxin [Planctomycetales bacterium]|nr:peroxiredoxin [Planctomycetales bacterium]
MSQQTLALGTRAPDFELPKQDGTTVRLSDFESRSNVVLFFFPKASTPGCTAEATAFRDALPAFRELSAEVLGMSTDMVEEQAAFAKACQIPFPLLADAARMVCSTYGALNGHGAARVTYLIDKAGVVRRVFSRVNPKGHPDDVLGALREIAQESKRVARSALGLPTNGAKKEAGALLAAAPVPAPPSPAPAPTAPAVPAAPAAVTPA